MAGPDSAQKLVPAHLDYLAIYNPSLGTSDETLDQQVVYYSSAESRQANRSLTQSKANKKGSPDELQNEKNQMLRQIGLAQGMVEFGKTFSGDKPVNTVETEKSRIVLHELESGWWILLSVNLTKFPVTASGSESKSATAAENVVEYSSREVKPSALLLQDVIRAHTTFLLHHASSMSALFVRTRRAKFMSILGRYWDSYISAWNVLLHGNPAVNIYGGIKLAACGELGMGVGEEDRGSGEREVLEGFVGRIDGLVDLIVSKFGDVDAEHTKSATIDSSGINAVPTQPWLGTGAEPAIEDGAVFLGIGALSRKSLRDVTHWMEDLYTWGSYAYGVIENPTSIRRPRRKKRPTAPERLGSCEGTPKKTEQPQVSDAQLGTGIKEQTASKNAPTRTSSIKSSSSIDSHKTLTNNTKHPNGRRPTFRRAVSVMSSTKSVKSTKSGTEKPSMLVSILKLGYGTHWSLGGSLAESPNQDQQQSQPVFAGIPGKVTDHVGVKSQPVEPPDETPLASAYPKDDSVGHYLVGMIGNLEDVDGANVELAETTADEDSDGHTEHRTLLRTVTVELERARDLRPEAAISIDLRQTDTMMDMNKTGSQHTKTSQVSYDSQDQNKTKKLRIIVYVNKPFIYTFLFELRTESLAFMDLYRALHHQLGPLQRPLLASTQNHLLRPKVSTTETQRATPIYDLIWDPELYTITSSIPNIPIGSQYDEGLSIWSRVEALNTHVQILNMFVTTRAEEQALERTSKTTRGWWVVWTRIPDIVPQPRSRSVSMAPSRERSLHSDSGTNAESNGQGKSAGKGFVAVASRSVSLANDSMNSGPAHPYLETSSPPRQAISLDKEIFLIRRASDNAGGMLSSRFTTTSLASGDGWGSGTARLAQGIGVDTKRYIEDLLSMGR